MSDFLKNAGGILASIAPGLASALGGPLAGTAVNALIGALGIAPNSSQTDVMKAIAGATPEQLLAIKTVEQEFLVKMKSLDVDIMSLEQKNTEGARQREIVVQDYTPRILSGLVLGLYIAINYYIFSGHVLDDGMRDMALRSLGTLDAALGLVLSYYFGSSLGSSNKNEQISTLLDTVAKK